MLSVTLVHSTPTGKKIAGADPVGPCEGKSGRLDAHTMAVGSAS